MREASGDNSESPHFIETVPRRGYRFIAPIETVGSGLSVTPIQVSQPDGASPNRRLFLAAAALVAVLLLLLGLSTGSRFLPRSSQPRIESLAVLPLQNLSSDPAQDYFADGMTDGLITEIARISSLRVISRTSTMRYKGAHKALPTIAKELALMRWSRGR